MAVGDRFVATLLQNESGELTRQDFSLEAWDAGARPDEPVVGLWHSTIPPEGQKRNRLIDNDALLDLFTQLQESAADPSRADLLYVLTLLLVRKRLLKVEPGPRGVLRVRRPGENADPAVDIAESGLDDVRLNEVSEQLLALVEGGEA